MHLRLHLWLWSPGGVGKVMLKLYFPLYFHEIENSSGQFPLWPCRLVELNPDILLSLSLDRGGWLGRSGPVFLTVGCQHNLLDVLAEEGRGNIRFLKD